MGGVCSLIARTDVLDGSTRTTLALVRYEDDTDYDGTPRTHVGFIAVDAGTSSEPSTGLPPQDGYGVDVPAGDDIVVDQHGNMAVLWHHRATTYSPAWTSIAVAGVRNGSLWSTHHDYSSSYDAADALHFLGFDANGYLQWEETRTADDGSTTVARFGIDESGDTFKAVHCSKTRNGDVFEYAPDYGRCNR
ncbi:hypothetical protein [Kineococcus arenarius]|uniref:hypothetical protein n=1 Tax=Kineococcus sp. SYSU DK007 TaxID=3383128 RepID=UPI003D7E6621